MENCSKFYGSSRDKVLRRLSALFVALLLAAMIVPLTSQQNSAKVPDTSPSVDSLNQQSFSPALVKASSYASGYSLPVMKTPGQSVRVSITNTNGDPLSASIEGFMYAPPSQGGGLIQVFQGMTSGGVFTTSNLAKALTLSDSWLQFNSYVETTAPHAIVLFITWFDSKGMHFEQASVPINAVDFLQGKSYSTTVQVPSSAPTASTSSYRLPKSNATVGSSEASDSVTVPPSNPPGCGSYPNCRWIADPTDPTDMFPSTPGYYGQIPIAWMTISGVTQGWLGFDLQSGSTSWFYTGLEWGPFGFTSTTVAEPGTYTQANPLLSATDPAESLPCGAPNCLNTVTSETVYLWGVIEGNLFDFQVYTSSGWAYANCNADKSSYGASCQQYDVGIPAYLAEDPQGNCPQPGPMSAQSSFTASSLTTTSTASTTGTEYLCTGFGAGVPNLPTAFSQQTTPATWGTFKGTGSTSGFDSDELGYNYLSTQVTWGEATIPVGSLIAMLVPGSAPIADALLDGLDLSINQGTFNFADGEVQMSYGTQAAYTSGYYVNVILSVGKLEYSLSDGLTGVVPTMGITLTSTTTHPYSVTPVALFDTVTSICNVTTNFTDGYICGLGSALNSDGSQWISPGSTIVLREVYSPFDPTLYPTLFAGWTSVPTFGTLAVSTSCGPTCPTASFSIDGNGTIYANYYSRVEISPTSSVCETSDTAVDLNTGQLMSSSTCLGPTTCQSMCGFEPMVQNTVCNTASDGQTVVYSFSDTSQFVQPNPLTNYQQCVTFFPTDYTFLIEAGNLNPTSFQFSETGLPSGASWSAVLDSYCLWPDAINGYPGIPCNYAPTSTSSSISFTNFPTNGAGGINYPWVVASVSAGGCTYTANPSSGTFYPGSSTSPVQISFSTICNVQVTFSVSGGGSVSPSGTETYAVGSVVSITASPESGYTFSSWGSSTSFITFANSGSSSTTATIDGEGTITAYFTSSGGGRCGVGVLHLYCE